MKVEINKKVSGKSQSSWKLNNTLLNDLWAKGSLRNIRKYFYLNENEYKIY